MSDATRGSVEEVYRQERERLWRSVWLFAGDRDIADDAVAEAFAQLLRRGDRIRSPRPWVWKAAFRIAAGELKGRRRQAPFLDEIVPDVAPDDKRVAAALLTLSRHQRSSVVLHYYAGYTYKEVAAIIGSTPSAVSVHVTRGRKRLRAALEDPDV